MGEQLLGLGNWDAFTDQGTTETRENNSANEITKIDGSNTNTAHDSAGNMIRVPKTDGSGEHFHLKYDAWNRLVKVYDDNGTTIVAEYEYDGRNFRTAKKKYSAGNLSETRHFYYNNDWQCLEERVEESSVIAANAATQYVWGEKFVDDLILRDRDADVDSQTGTAGLEERIYALHDANFNVTALASTDGTILERYAYAAYGQIKIFDADFTIDADNLSDHNWHYTYTTRRLDTETGLMYYRNRYYHTNIGRFINRDPIDYEGSDGNLYRAYFVSNAIDPSGLMAKAVQIYVNTTGSENLTVPFNISKIETHLKTMLTKAGITVPVFLTKTTLSKNSKSLNLGFNYTTISWLAESPWHGWVSSAIIDTYNYCTREVVYYEHYVAFNPKQALYVARTSNYITEIAIPGFNKSWEIAHKGNSNRANKSSLTFANIIAHEVFWLGVLGHSGDAWFASVGDLGHAIGSTNKATKITPAEALKINNKLQDGGWDD